LITRLKSKWISVTTASFENVNKAFTRTSSQTHRH
jgi:hypothetical protein